MTMTVEVWARTRGVEVAVRRRRVADLSGVNMVAEAEWDICSSEKEPKASGVYVAAEEERRNRRKDLGLPINALCTIALSKHGDGLVAKTAGAGNVASGGLKLPRLLSLS